MKKIKKYLSKKEYIIFALSLIIILLSTFSFAFYYSVDNTQESIVTSECFKLSFEDQNDINLDKAYPISDSEGSNLKPYTFTIRNVCKRAGNYQVNIETLNNSTLLTNYLKYKLDNKTPSILGNQLEVQEYINNNVSDSRNIEVGLILSNEEVTYSLRLWIDEDSTYEQTSSKEYQGKVVVKTIENKEPYQTITLNTNGGEITNNEIIKVKTRSIGELEEPTRLGYDFEGWYLDSALTNKINNNTIVTNEMNEIYAKYTARNDTLYTVEHYQMDTNGNYPQTPFETQNLYGTTDTNVTPEVKTYEHFKNPQTQTVNVDSDGSRVVKYYYERNKYTITYNANGGSVSPTSVTDYYGKTITLPTPTRTGYTTTGWYSTTSGGTKFNSPYTVTGNITMHANWQINPLYVIKNGVIQDNRWISNAQPVTGHNSSGSPTITNYSGYIKYSMDTTGSMIISTNYKIDLSKYNNFNVKFKDGKSGVVTLDESSENHFNGQYIQIGPSANSTVSKSISSLTQSAVLSIDIWNYGYLEIIDIWFS